MYNCTYSITSPSINQKTEGGRVSYIFENVYIRAGRYPLTKTGKKKIFSGVSEDYRKMAMTKDDKSIQHGGGEFHEDVLSY